MLRIKTTAGIEIIINKKLSAIDLIDLKGTPTVRIGKVIHVVSEIEEL